MGGPAPLIKYWGGLGPPASYAPGTMYKVGCVLWINNDEEETPQFTTLKDICVIETDLKNIMLIAEALTTVTFNKHLNAYEVINTADLIFLQQDELLYPLPLHIVTATDQEHVKSFVCPRYHVPNI